MTPSSLCAPRIDLRTLAQSIVEAQSTHTPLATTPAVSAAQTFVRFLRGMRFLVCRSTRAMYAIDVFMLFAAAYYCAQHRIRYNL